MTEQQIDRDQLRAVADHAEQANSAVYLAPRSLRSLLDQADQAEAELESWMTRAYEAEGKLWKAEARIGRLENRAASETARANAWREKHRVMARKRDVAHRAWFEEYRARRALDGDA